MPLPADVAVFDVPEVDAPGGLTDTELVVTARPGTDGFRLQLPSDVTHKGGVADGSVSTAKLADDAVTGRKIGAGEVAEGHIADGAVTARKIPRDTIDQDHLRADSVGHSELRADSVGTQEVQDGSIVSSKLSQSIRDAIDAAATTGGLSATQAAKLAARSLNPQADGAAQSADYALRGAYTTRAFDQTVWNANGLAAGQVMVNPAGDPRHVKIALRDEDVEVESFLEDAEANECRVRIRLENQTVHVQGNLDADHARSNNVREWVLKNPAINNADAGSAVTVHIQSAIAARIDTLIANTLGTLGPLREDEDHLQDRVGSLEKKDEDLEQRLDHERKKVDALDALTADLEVVDDAVWAANSNDDVSFAIVPSTDPNYARVAAGTVPEGLAFHTARQSDIVHGDDRTRSRFIVRVRKTFAGKLADYRLSYDGGKNHSLLWVWQEFASDATYRYLTYYAAANAPLSWIFESGQADLEHHGTGTHTRFLGEVRDASGVAARVYRSTQSGQVIPSLEVSPGRSSSQVRLILRWRGRHDSVGEPAQYIVLRRGTTELARATQDYVVAGRYEHRVIEFVDMPLTTSEVRYNALAVGESAASNIDYRDMVITAIDYGATPAPAQQQAPAVTAYPRHAWYFRWVESTAAAPTFQGATWAAGNFFNIPAGWTTTYQAPPAAAGWTLYIAFAVADSLGNVSGYVQASTPGLNTLYWTAREGNASSTFVAGTHHYMQINGGPLIPLDDPAIAETDFSWTPLLTHTATYGGSDHIFSHILPPIDLNDWSEMRMRIANHGFGTPPPYHRDSVTNALSVALIRDLADHDELDFGRGYGLMASVGDGRAELAVGGEQASSWPQYEGAQIPWVLRRQQHAPTNTRTIHSTVAKPRTGNYNNVAAHQLTVQWEFR